MNVNSLDFLKTFKDKNKRTLKVLHIGNIANNAYINSKLMQKIGIESDVLCYDYYHIMGCPEWEECDLNKMIDHFYPNFLFIDRKGFKRPEWFVQGPRVKAIKYLIHRNAKHKIRAFYYKYLLRFYVISIGIYGKEYKCSLFQKTLNFFRRGFRFLRILPGRLKRRIQRDILKLSPAKTHTSETKNNKTLWDELFNAYDVVIGYAIDAIWPKQAGFRHYVAYEHGTVKALPFMGTDVGNICKEVYTNAPVIFVTNTDSYRIGKEVLFTEKSTVYALPHAFESSRAISFYKNNVEASVLMKKKNVFFAPARHHWKNGEPKLWHKGNNVVIEAIKILAGMHGDFKVILVDWGAEVALSKEYIETLGVSHLVEWIQPVSKSKLWEYYLCCAGVIDQFVTPAIGGVVFEAFALAAPVLTYLNEEEVTTFFGEMPPMYNSPDANTLANSMYSIMMDPEKADAIGKKAQQWLLKYHSEEKIMQIQLGAFEAMMYHKGEASYEKN